MYEVEFADGENASLTANYIAENLFAQVDDEGNRQVLMNEIIDYRTNGTKLKQQDAFITTKTGTRRRRETTKGWELLIEWKDGSTNWVSLKVVKESYLVEVAEFALATRISMNLHSHGGSCSCLKRETEYLLRSSPSIGSGPTSLVFTSPNQLRRRRR